jgi:16S rRNA (guanine1207-N2)-methyltransferase/23S rRNA (guanine1835-N2)-methyltransferase
VFDIVLIKIPRTLALLQQQLIDIRPHLHANTRIIGAAKVKSVTTNVLKMFTTLIGATTTSLAVKKARLIFSSIDQSFVPKNPFPSKVEDAAIDFSLYNHANVFCREQLDIGARLLLANLPHHFKGAAIDLGCGNGVLGVAMLVRHSEATLTFVDESFMAIASAKLTAEAALAPHIFANNTQFEVSHCLQTLLQHQAPKVDLILCNPPFHQQNVLTDEIAWQMFVDAKRMLKPNGELRIVANRHLNYHDKLQRLFGACKVLADNRKFVVLSAIKRA